MNAVPTRGPRGFWSIVPPTLQQINDKAAEADVALDDAKKDLHPIRVVHGTPTFNATAPSSMTVASLQEILDAGTQVHDEISHDLKKRADALTRIADMEDELGRTLGEAREKWEHAQSMADTSRWESPAFDDIAQLASDDEIAMILRVALYLVDDLGILPKLSVESLSDLMRDAVAINKSRHPAQQEPGPSTSAMGSQIRLGEIADLRAAHDELQRQLDKMKEEATRSKQPLERLQEQVEGLMDERDGLVARLNNANKTITMEQKQFETAQAMLDDMTEMNNKILEKYDNLRTTYKELQGRCNSRQLVPDTQDAESQSEVLAELADEVERLTTELSTSEAAATRARGDRDDAEGRLQAMEVQLADANQQFRDAEKCLETDDGEAIQMAAKATEEAYQVTIALGALSTTHGDLVRTHEATTAELQQTRDEKRTLQAQQKALSARLRESEQKSADATTAYGRVQAELKSLQVEHRQLGKTCTNYRTSWAHKLASLPTPAARKPAGANLADVRQFLCRLGVPLTGMELDEWRQVAGCIEKQTMQDAPSHEEWVISPPSMASDGLDRLQLECLHVLAALWPNGDSLDLKSSVARLSNCAMHVRTLFSNPELVTLTLHRLLAHEAASCEIVFMAAVTASSLGLQDVKSTIAELLSKVPADDQKARRPFDALSNLAISTGFDTDALRRYCDDEGMVQEDSDVGILVGIDGVYVVFEFGLRRAHMVGRHQVKLIDVEDTDSLLPHREFSLVDGRRIEVAIPPDKTYIVIRAGWSSAWAARTLS